MSFSMRNILRVKNIVPLRTLKETFYEEIFIYDTILGIIFDDKGILVELLFYVHVLLCLHLTFYVVFKIKFNIVFLVFFYS